MYYNCKCTFEMINKNNLQKKNVLLLRKLSLLWMAKYFKII